MSEQIPVEQPGPNEIAPVGLVRDPEQARFMAYAERPFREEAITQRAAADEAVADNMKGYLDGEATYGGNWNHQRSGLTYGERALEAHRSAQANVEKAKQIGDIAAEAYSRLQPKDQ